MGAGRRLRLGRTEKPPHGLSTSGFLVILSPSCGGIKKVTCVFTKVSTGVRWVGGAHLRRPSCRMKREGVEEALYVKQGTLYP